MTVSFAGMFSIFYDLCLVISLSLHAEQIGQEILENLSHDREKIQRARERVSFYETIPCSSICSVYHQNLLLLILI